MRGPQADMTQPPAARRPASGAVGRVPPRASHVFTGLRFSGGRLDPSHAGQDHSRGQDRLRGGFWKELRGGCCSKSDKKGWELKDDNLCDKGSALWIRYVT